MAYLQYDFTIPEWYTGSFAYIEYIATYDPDTNSTTVTFGTSHHRIYGQNGYNHRSHTTITVTATDSGNSAEASMYIEGTTDGGQKIFYDTFSPTSVTVKHSDTTGAKSIKIDGFSQVDLFYSGGSDWSASGSGSVTVETGERKGYYCIDDGSKILQCIPYIDNGSAWLACIPYVDNGSTWKSGS